MCMRPAVLLLMATAGPGFSQLPDIGLAPRLPVATKTIVAALIGALQDSDLEVRTNAAVALANVGNDAVEALTATLADRNKDARAAAAYALGQIGGPAASATESLMKALKDEDKEVRRQSAQALSRIIAGTKAQSGERTLTPPVPIPPGDAPPPIFPSEKPK